MTLSLDERGAESWYDANENVFFTGKEQQGFNHGAELVLAALVAHHHGNDRDFVVIDKMDDGAGNFGLIGRERFLDDECGEAFDRIMHWEVFTMLAEHHSAKKQRSIIAFIDHRFFSSHKCIINAA